MKQQIGTLRIVIVLLGINVITYGSTAPTTKCLSSVQTGVYYAGNTGPRIDNIMKYQDCQAACENDSICYGWQYQASGNSCWLQSSIGLLYTDPSYTAGSCISPAAKVTPCTENLSGTYYNGNSGSAIHNVASTADCMKKCDADSTCLGWSYRSSDGSCWPQTTVLGRMSSSAYSGGACVKSQPPYPAITIDQFRDQALQQTNLYRSQHGSPACKLDAGLNNISQTYAQHLASTNVFEHSGNTYNGNYMGENLYMASGLSQPMYAKGGDAVADWYAEIDSYDWSNPGFSESTGHFTQVVWSNTTLCGFGRAVSSDGETFYVVGNFFPGGNMIGAFPTNVLKPK